MNLSIKYGLIAGISTIAYFLLFYGLNKEMMLAPWVWWSSLLIYIYAMYRSIDGERVQAGDSYGMREAIKAGFVTFICANALFYLFNYILFVLVDPTLLELQEKLMGNSNEEFKPADNIAGAFFFSYCFSLIGGFIISAIIAGFVTRK